VQRDAAGLRGVDAGDDHVMAERAAARHDGVEEQAADAAAVTVAIDVDRVLDGARVPAARVVARERRPADDLVALSATSSGCADRARETTRPTFVRLGLELIRAVECIT